MHRAVTSAEITASAVMKMSVAGRCRFEVTVEIHLGQQLSAVPRLHIPAHACDLWDWCGPLLAATG